MMYKIVFLFTVLGLFSLSCGKWLDDNKLKDETVTKVKVQAKEYVVNLDLPQEERWKEIGEEYADRAW